MHGRLAVAVVRLALRLRTMLGGELLSIRPIAWPLLIRLALLVGLAWCFRLTQWLLLAWRLSLTARLGSGPHRLALIGKSLGAWLVPAWLRWTARLPAGQRRRLLWLLLRFLWLRLLRRRWLRLLVMRLP